MNHEEAMRILKALIEGNDPVSAKSLAADSVLHNVSVVRALLLAKEALQANVDRQKRREMLPPRVGIEWTDEEDQKLIAAWKEQQPLEDIASSHGRTLRAIESRLERLGLITAEQRKTSFAFPGTPGGGGGQEGGTRRRRGRPSSEGGGGSTITAAE
jgi:hypothetical protein